MHEILNRSAYYFSSFTFYSYFKWFTEIVIFFKKIDNVVEKYGNI